MGILATLSPFLHMLHGSYPQRRRSIAHETPDLMPTHILLDTRNLVQELQVFYQDLQPEDVRSILKDSTCKQVSRLTNDAFRSTKLLRQIRLEQLAQNANMEEYFGYFVHAIAAMKSLYCVGLEKSILHLKRPYFQNKVGVIGVRCMRELEGVGKNTFALDLCDDLNIEENMEKLLFQAGGYKTLLTARQRSIISRKHSIQFYQLSFLGQEDALSISYLYGEPYDVWEIAKTKLSKGELVSDSHLDSSTLALDFQWTKKSLQMHFCTFGFMFGSFERLEAFTNSLELASRNLLKANIANLNFKSLDLLIMPNMMIELIRSTAATFYGYAAERELVFAFGRPRRCIPEE